MPKYRCRQLSNSLLVKLGTACQFFSISKSPSLSSHLFLFPSNGAAVALHGSAHGVAAAWSVPTSLLPLGQRRRQGGHLFPSSPSLDEVLGIDYS
jgi:hypothetical protein